MVKIKHDDIEVELDDAALQFNETNLNEYLMKEASLYAHLVQKQAELEHLLERTDNEYEALYSAKFVVWKEEGGSDQLIHAKCKADTELLGLKNKMADIKKDATAVKLHLKAWDMCHENDQSFGHNLRKEMYKLGNDIYKSDYNDSRLADDLDAIMRKKAD